MEKNRIENVHIDVVYFIRQKTCSTARISVISSSRTQLSASVLDKLYLLFTDKEEAGTESCSSASRCSHGTNPRLVLDTERQTLINIKLPFAYSKANGSSRCALF